MITITLNGEQAQLSPELFLSEAIEQWGYENQAFAIAINKSFVPRSAYQAVTLKEGDQIELVSPVQGG